MKRSLARLLVAGSILSMGVAAQAQSPTIIWGTITDSSSRNITWGGQSGTNKTIIWGTITEPEVTSKNITWGGQSGTTKNITWGGQSGTNKTIIWGTLVSSVTGNVLASARNIYWGNGKP